LRQFQGLQGQARIREKRYERAVEEPGGDHPRFLEVLLSFFSLILTFPKSSRNCLKQA